MKLNGTMRPKIIRSVTYQWRNCYVPASNPWHCAVRFSHGVPVATLTQYVQSVSKFRALRARAHYHRMHSWTIYPLFVTFFMCDFENDAAINWIRYAIFHSNDSEILTKLRYRNRNRHLLWNRMLKMIRCKLHSCALLSNVIEISVRRFGAAAEPPLCACIDELPQNRKVNSEINETRSIRCETVCSLGELA